MRFLQLVGKRYPFKAVYTLGKKRGKQQKKIIPFRQTLLESIRPLPEPIEFFVLGTSSILWEAPVSTRKETLAKELYLERSEFGFDRQPNGWAADPVGEEPK